MYVKVVICKVIETHFTVADSIIQGLTYPFCKYECDKIQIQSLFKSECGIPRVIVIKFKYVQFLTLLHHQRCRLDTL